MIIHGHEQLISYLNENKNEIEITKLIEIGATREVKPDQNSTLKLCKFCNENNIKFISVDMDEKNVKQNDIILNKHKLKYESYIQKGEVFLQQYDDVVDVIYLDAFDYDHGRHSIQRKQRYETILKTKISNDACFNMHLECAKEIQKKSKIGTIVCFDDIYNETTFEGKGKTAIPYLLNNGFEIQEYQPTTMILKRIN